MARRTKKPEPVEYCKYSRIRDWNRVRCNNKAKKDGYCMTHHPDKVKERHDKANAKFKADMAATRKARKDATRHQKELHDKAARCDEAERKLVELAGKVRGVAQAMMRYPGMGCDNDTASRWANRIIELVEQDVFEGDKSDTSEGE